MKGDFQSHFGKHARDYSKSVSHKSGADLAQLISALSLMGNETCVDMAAGTGFTSIELAKKGKLVYAVDGTPEMLEEARKLATQNNLLNIRFILGRIENVPLNDGSADIITCRRAAHHFHDKAAFLNECKRLLKYGGRIGIVDMVRNEEDSEDLRNRLEKIRDPSHVYAPKISEWKELLRDSGFKNIKVEEAVEKFDYDKWLYPIKVGGDEDKKIRDIVSDISEDFLKNAGFDKASMTFEKKRMILTATKL